jgi:DNA-binding transcriptional MocR family regulator
MTMMVKVMGMKIGSPIKKLIMLKLADNANDYGECWPSYSHISDHCEIGKSTARKHIKELEAKGFLRIENRKGPKGNTSNLYHIVLDPIALGGTPCSTIEHTPVAPRSTGTSQVEPVSKPVIEPIKKSNLDWGDIDLTDDQKNDIKGIRQASKKKLTQLALNPILKEFVKAKNQYGIDYQESIEIWAVRGWVAYQADWAANHKGINNGQSQRNQATLSNLGDTDF